MRAIQEAQQALKKNERAAEVKRVRSTSSLPRTDSELQRQQVGGAGRGCRRLAHCVTLPCTPWLADCRWRGCARCRRIALCGLVTMRTGWKEPPPAALRRAASLQMEADRAERAARLAEPAKTSVAQPLPGAGARIATAKDAGINTGCDC